MTPLLRIENLTVRYPGRSGFFGKTAANTAVKDVSFEIKAGQTAGLVGESGSGKTSIGRALVKLIPVSSGKIFYAGEDITSLTPRQFFPWRKRIQMVFQDPWHSLNPRLTIGTILAEPLEIHFPSLDAAARRAKVAALLTTVGLTPDHAQRYPHELSGGQRQRTGIARALAVEPELIICDEPVSALDVSVQAQIVNLLQDLQEERGFACLFISHDLAVVEHISHHVLVLHRGTLVEQGTPEELYKHPVHDYTKQLLDAVPSF